MQVVLKKIESFPEKGSFVMRMSLMKGKDFLKDP
jgi:hypothetical protein